MTLDRLAEAVRLCSACALGARGKGVPGRFVGETGTHVDLVGAGSTLMVVGEAPGAIEMERGKPFVGQSGELLHAMFQECGLTTYYVSNIAKHQPYKDRHGKQQAPSKTEIEACAPFLRAEFELIRPSRLSLLGKTAAKLVVDGNFSMKDVVNTTRKYRTCPSQMCGETKVQGEYFSCDTGDAPHAEIPTLVLYHPAYFLRQRTAPWIQKSIREWKSAVRLFLGAKAPSYQIEEVRCEVHN